jgi:hypothetical protein
MFSATAIIPHPISFAYRAGLFGVALGLLALPLIYFGLVAAIAFGVWFHVTHDSAVLKAAGLPGLVAYIIPCIVGPALIWFMLRPFFTKQVKVAPLPEIKAANEPIIFEFVGRICDLVRAPRPKHVYVDLAANAGASINGVHGLLRRELNLTIGLPLVAALNVRQFGGVLAHEFGHFAQGAGMRLSFLIRIFNDWIARIAFQPDAIEQEIAGRVGRGGLYGASIALALRVSFWITRRLLHAVLLLSHAISCYAMRQMEHDADLYEAKIAGADAFATVIQKFRWLNDGSSRAMTLLQRGASEGKCPANLVELINARADAAQDYDVWGYDESAEQLTGYFDTHPSPAKRIAYVKRFRTTPVLVDERPANSLFVSFDLLARENTVEFYREAGLPIEDFILEELDAFCEGEVLSRPQIAALKRFFADRAFVEHPFSISADELANADGADLCELLRDWNVAREQTDPAFLTFARTRMRRLQLLRAHTLINARIRFNPRRFGLPSRSPAEIEQKLQAAGKACADAYQELAPFDVACHRRMAHALKSTNRTIAYYLDVLSLVQKIAPLYTKTYETLVCLGDLIASNRSHRPKTKAHRQMLNFSDSLKADLNLLTANLDVQDPVRSGMTIAGRIASRLPSTQLPFEQQVFLEAREYLTCLASIYFQCLARICVVAAENEAVSVVD